MTVGELLGRISSRELSEWMAYDQEEPFGEERADLRAGIVAATVANVNRGRHRPFEPKDFMPLIRDRREARRKSPKELYEMMRAWAVGVK